ncbi:hypothetical protein GPECTOR_15g404 [Gonium pectorale]|uniref:F-box protein Hrt3/FBXO9 C-terminal domain-containing protein n=1 Tax=Gonium pectorale TaxID=33097 RepID=A0A150GMZ9_GONPE|nr:hypothetical protein GPECTOR_15g404 [Gonium pectorale]|eukprot:KXZ50720.1 hypothetical protein GPECTOR_15g404 [Gonium pectorale]
MVFGYLDPYSLGKAALHPRLWERVCQDTFSLALPDPDALQRLVASQYRFSWKRLFVHHPHLRFDGIYVCECRGFLPDGTFLYRTSPNAIGKVARSLCAATWLLGPGALGSHGHYAPRLPRGKESAPTAKELERERGAVLAGRYAMRDTKVLCALVYPNSTSTELRCRMALRSSRPGGHDRLDIESITTYDRELGTEAAVQPQQPADADPDAPAPDSSRSHSRGLSPCVFVPWEDILSSPLNLPPHQMDFMIA